MARVVLPHRAVQDFRRERVPDAHGVRETAPRQPVTRSGFGDDQIAQRAGNVGAERFAERRKRIRFRRNLRDDAERCRRTQQSLQRARVSIRLAREVFERSRAFSDQIGHAQLCGRAHDLRDPHPGHHLQHRGARRRPRLFGHQFLRFNRLRRREYARKPRPDCRRRDTSPPAIRSGTRRVRRATRSLLRIAVCGPCSAARPCR